MGWRGVPRAPTILLGFNVIALFCNLNRAVQRTLRLGEKVAVIKSEQECTMTREIGGNYGASEDTESVWEAWINNRPFTFRKNRQKGGVFLYSCEKTGDPKSVTSFFSERNLTPEEFEALPQFIAFVSATM